MTDIGDQFNQARALQKDLEVQLRGVSDTIAGIRDAMSKVISSQEAVVADIGRLKISRDAAVKQFDADRERISKDLEDTKVKRSAELDADFRAQRDSLQRETDQLRRDVSRLSEDTLKAKAVHEETINALTTQLSNEKARLSADLAAAKTAHQIAMAGLSKQQADLTEAVASATRLLESLRTEGTQATQDLDRLQSMVRSLSAKMG